MPACFKEAAARITLMAHLGIPHIGEQAIRPNVVAEYGHRRFSGQDELRRQYSRLVAEDRACPAIEPVHRLQSTRRVGPPPAEQCIAGHESFGPQQHDRLPWGHELGSADLAPRVMTIRQRARDRIALVHPQPVFQSADNPDSVRRSVPATGSPPKQFGCLEPPVTGQPVTSPVDLVLAPQPQPHPARKRVQQNYAGHPPGYPGHLQGGGVSRTASPISWSRFSAWQRVQKPPDMSKTTVPPQPECVQDSSSVVGNSAAC